jgi:xylan 1,4-beta-xylosidase
MISNPVLPGFNPDPSVVRVGEDYYLATSTFHWFPGVNIYHFRDPGQMRLVARPLNRVSQLNMLGNPDSGGIWAPDISYHDGTFYLVFTDVKTHTGAFKDTHNYLVTATDVCGPWSEPVYLNSSGFDPSMFVDEDGTVYVVGMHWDYRTYRNQFGGIWLAEYSPQERKLVGEPITIYHGTSLGKTEGPHIYRYGGFYHLLTAEGGTSYEHAVTMARSRNLTGPYEPDPGNPILTSHDKPNNPLQKAGHADLVETPDGEWYMVHLCARPLPGTRNCPLGRETALQRVVWTTEAHVRLEHGGREPELHARQSGGRSPTAATTSKPHIEAGVKRPEGRFGGTRYDFDSGHIPLEFQSLREPATPDWCTLDARPGFLRLYGRESLSSHFHQSLLARRITAFEILALTCVDFHPESYKQAAGLVCYYDTDRYHYCFISADEEAGRTLSLVSCLDGRHEFPIGGRSPFVQLEFDGPVFLRVVTDYAALRFAYSENGFQWRAVGPELETAVLSDEYSRKKSFTGAFVGMCCQDLQGLRRPADFDFFEYRSTAAGAVAGVSESIGVKH